MRNKVLVTLILAATWSGTTSAQEEKAVRSISVSGTVVTKTAPDQVVWSISLSDAAKAMRKAKTANDEKVKAVVALRGKLGIGDGDLETGQINIRREYERGQHGSRGAFKHYAVSRGVTIRQRDLKRFDEFLDALVASTEMEVSFAFETSRIHDVRAETRLEALKVARNKAADLAEVVGAKLGRVLTIEEGPSTAAVGAEVIAALGASGCQLQSVRRLGNDGIIPSSVDAELQAIPSVERITQTIKEMV